MERIGLLFPRPHDGRGWFGLMLPNEKFVLVDPSLSHDEIAAMHNLDRVQPPPHIRICTATYIDGPLEGQTLPYAPVELGARTDRSRPTPSGREVLTYELVALPDGDEPGKLRFVSSRVRSSS